MSYVLSIVHPPENGATFGKAEVTEVVTHVQYAADLAGQMLIDGGENTLPARFFANHLANEVHSMPYAYPGTGLTFRIDPADNAPHPCPCCGRLVLPDAHGQARHEDAYCLGCYTWARGDEGCLPRNTAHSNERHRP